MTDYEYQTIASEQQIKNICSLLNGTVKQYTCSNSTTNYKQIIIIYDVEQK